MEQPHWRQNRSVICNCCWSSPAQSFSGPSPAGLMTTFYGLRLETPQTWRVAQLYPQALGSLFVATYDLQGYGGGIGPRFHTGNWNIVKVRSYITTGGLPPISIFWRQDPREEKFSELNPCGNSPYVTSSNEKVGVSVMNMLGLSSYVLVHVAHIARALFQYRLLRADHAYLTYEYLVLQRQSSHLNGCKLDHR
jgi:hypothetical protein